MTRTVHSPAMRQSYTEQLGPFSLAVIDAHPAGERTWRIARVNVPLKHRGQGAGSKLMEWICADADAAGVTLTLEPIPYDGPERLADLVRFYERFGFRTVESGAMTRIPSRTP